VDKSPNILIVDDEHEVGSFFKRLLERKGYNVYVAHDGKEFEALINGNDYQLALVDVKLPDTNGLELLERIKTIQPYCEVIIMTGYSTTRTAIKAIQLGAFDYMEKPFEDIDELEGLIEKAMELSRHFSGEGGGQPEWLETAERQGFQVGSSQKMKRLVAVAHKIAKKNINVLIQGETGTGKEVLARFVHACSLRSQNTFIPINCGALQESLLESELFGHEKGAFTGASGKRRGIFEIANKGTLFLDEIGEASLGIQVKLLRVLETGEFLRVGGEKTVKTDVRLIAATNVDLQKAVENKEFREDLFYRLDVVRLEIPPLRERKEDIPMLAHYFLKRKAGDRPLQISPEAMEMLKRYSWPGNIRELVNTIDQAVALVEGNVIVPGCLSDKIRNETTKRDDGSGIVGIPAGGFRPNYRNLVYRLEEMLSRDEYLDELGDGELLTAYRLTKQLESRLKSIMSEKGMPGPLPPSLEEVEREVIQETLEYYRGNISNTARSLGMGRNTLYRKLKDYEISVK